MLDGILGPPDVGCRLLKGEEPLADRLWGRRPQPPFEPGSNPVGEELEELIEAGCAGVIHIQPRLCSSVALAESIAAELRCAAPFRLRDGSRSSSRRERETNRSAAVQVSCRP